MKNLQQLLFVALGVLIGLLLGVVVISATNTTLTEATVREIVAQNNTQIINEVALAVAQANVADQGRDIRRNVNPLTAADSTFFQVTMEEVAEWLESLIEAEDVELSAEVIEAVLAANGIASSAELELYFRQQVNTVDGVLANVYQMLLAVIGDADDDLELAVCLGLDSDPYSLIGPVIYLYLQIPDEEAEALPKDWGVLPGPREESMLWSVECYDPETAVITLAG